MKASLREMSHEMFHHSHVCVYSHVNSSKLTRIRGVPPDPGTHVHGGRSPERRNDNETELRPRDGSEIREPGRTTMEFELESRERSVRELRRERDLERE